jgi:uncharacterized protein
MRDHLLARDDDGRPRLAGASCRACNRSHFPGSATCPWCGGADTVEVLLSSQGRLVGWTSVLTAPPGYSGSVPYGLGIVELPEGIEVISRLTEPGTDALVRGQPMRLVDDPVSVWAFEPAR